MHDPRAIANYFIRKGNDNEKVFTITQLLKLTYISHGYCLALTKKPLSNQEPKAWQYGPVFPKLYYELKNIDSWPAVTNDFECKNNGKFTENEKKILDFVYEKYSGLDGWKLSKLTHEKDTPWEIASRNGPKATIPNGSIQEHFTKLFLTKEYN